MPLTPNGKLDRNALLVPEHPTATDATSVAPETPTERALADLWQTTLRIDRVGLKDNFFESGGHSLLAMQLVRRIHESFGVELPLQNLFQRPLLRDLAARIDDLRATAMAQHEMVTGELAKGFEYGKV
jgi:acyl carrier protein